MAESYYCEKCGKTMNPESFYTSNNLEKYPDGGKLHECKKCLTMHVDNWNPDSYLWILQEIDVPWVPKEWNSLLAKYGQDKAKLTGLSILGRYLSKMKLKQYRDFRWKDTEFLQELENQKIEQTMKRQGFSAAEIAEAVQKGTFEVPEDVLRPPEPEIVESSEPEDLFTSAEIENSMVSDLTEEDRTYLCLKWGKSYRPDEWIRLEQLYEEMMSSYDIQSAGHIDTLKLVCKTSLKANQLLDLGDVDGAQKMLKMYDSLMKSGKFTAAQNKAESGEYVDSISELVAICEREGFIPRYYTDGPQDKVDKVLIDTQHYVHNLVTEEMGLGQLIENAVKLLQQEQINIEDAGANGVDDEQSEDSLFDYEKDVVELNDEDYDEFNEMEDEAEAQDNDYLISLLEGEDG